MTTAPLKWTGEIRDSRLEAMYRAEVWSEFMRSTGVICALIGLFYFLAGLGTVMNLGWTARVTWLVAFRGIVAGYCLFITMYTRHTRNVDRLPVMLAGMFVLIGLFESVEAVWTYTPGLEYSVPFTLLIVFLSYLLFPYLLQPIMAAWLLHHGFIYRAL